MAEIISKLTILFEEPFWIGLYEREADGLYEACKITFGAEPRDCEVYEFLLKNWRKLRFSPAVKAEPSRKKPANPKRMQRLIHKQTQETAIGTKAQQALKLQHEQGKSARKIHARRQREIEKERRFELRQQKRKEKHRGH